MIQRKKDRPMPNLFFRSMSLMFIMRDMFSSPIKHLEETGMQKGNIVLDYGCGPGSYAIPAAEKVGENGKVYAADIHPLALKKISNKAIRKQISNIETILTNCDTGLAAESVDIVLLFDVIHLFKEPEKIFTEMYRVLKSNGILSVLNPHMTDEAIIEKVVSNSSFKLDQKERKTFSFKKK
ncbi:MAG: class I SAM-dependent methyltransferase [Asgard group archaeon]|nr:class I SAM-dependent methyltransferase [Asgard group archaeon]